MNSENSSVQTHLTIIQNVIQRMAANSNACKFWCVALVSATLLVVGQDGNPNHVLISFVPLASLFVINTYYHAQERRFISAYKDTVTRLHLGKIETNDVYVIDPYESVVDNLVPSLRSFPIWSFYGTLALTIILTWLVIL